MSSKPSGAALISIERFGTGKGPLGAMLQVSVSPSTSPAGMKNVAAGSGKPTVMIGRMLATGDAAFGVALMMDSTRKCQSSLTSARLLTRAVP